MCSSSIPRAGVVIHIHRAGFMQAPNTLKKEVTVYVISESETSYCLHSRLKRRTKFILKYKDIIQFPKY